MQGAIMLGRKRSLRAPRVTNEWSGQGDDSDFTPLLLASLRYRAARIDRALITIWASKSWIVGAGGCRHA